LQEYESAVNVVSSWSPVSQGARDREFGLPEKGSGMNVLVVDVGGTSVKVLATGQDEPRRFLSGHAITPEQMVSGVKQISQWLGV
jgi:hypothetical protein